MADRDRPLQPKGMKAIAAVAQHYKSTFLSFDHILSSPANRAMHTAAILAHEIGFSFSKVQLSEALYTFNGRQVIEQLHQLQEQWSKIILVGHNPAFSDAADVAVGAVCCVGTSHSKCEYGEVLADFGCELATLTVCTVLCCDGLAGEILRSAYVRRKISHCDSPL